MSDLPLQRLSVPNKQHLDLYAGVLVPALFNYLHVTAVIRPTVRRGTTGTALSFNFTYYVQYLFSFLDRDTLRLDMCNASYDHNHAWPIQPVREL